MKTHLNARSAATAIAMTLALPCAAIGNELVNKTGYGDDWPFPFDGGSVTCDPPGNFVVLKTDGLIYALNGKARGQAAKRGYIDVHDIMPRDEYGMFKKGVDTVSKLIDIGLRFCR